MKKIKFVFLLLISFMFSITSVYAGGSASLSVSKGSIENGSSVTASVKVSGTAAWNVTITSAGSTSGCTQKFVGDSGTGENTSKTFSVTCKSTSTGIISFTMSGDITSSDGTNTKISGSKQVTVTVPREKSKNNKLSSLGVEGYEITPKFDASVNEYTVIVPSTVEKINITAKKADGYAKLDGTGEKTVEEGTNTFEIVVTSETGVANTYKLVVNVEDQNPILVTVDGKKYTVVKIAKDLEKPELFDDTTVKINDIDVPAFTNEISKYTLVGLKDETGKISLFIYKDGKYTKFNEFKSDSLSIIFMDMKNVPKGYIKTSIKINEQSLVAYKLKGDKKLLLYGINLATGKENYYTYDSKEKTLQIFDKDKYEEDLKENDTNKYLIYGLSGVILVLFILLSLIASKNNKMKKLLILKDDKKSTN